MALTAPAAKDDHACRNIESFRLKPNDGDRIVVEQCPHSEDSPRVRIYRRDRVTTIQPEGGLVSVAEGLQGTHGAPANEFRSKWVYAPKGYQRNGRSTIILFGYPFASDPGSLRVVQIPTDGQPELVFSDDTFQINSLQRSTNSFRLIGHRSFAQMSGKCTATYDPASVVQIGFDGKAVYSASLSREYNITHGYVWAGPKTREDIGVNICRRPARIMRPK
jgi:hypothetical protein